MKKHYLIASNKENKYWNWSGGNGGNGGWSEVGNYYQTKESAEIEIEALKLDAHVEFDEW